MTVCVEHLSTLIMSMNMMSGFSCMVGNPPFLGGQKLTSHYGTSFRDFLVKVVAQKPGSIDLCTYFLIQSFHRLSQDGRLGIVSTNTIAEGINSKLGLQSLIEGGARITNANRNVAWGRGANVVVHLISMSNQEKQVDCYLDGEHVDFINSTLEAGDENTKPPSKLSQNAGICYQGSVILGDGFLLTKDEVKELVELNHENSNFIKECVGGRDLSKNPDGKASRHVIDVGHLTLNQLKQLPALHQRILNTVKPERDTNKSKQRRENWWKFGAQAKTLYDAISQLDEVIVVPETSTHCKMRKVSASQIFMHSIKVFATSSDYFYGIILSNIHDMWVERYSATLGKGRRYQPSNCFETFPFPEKGDSNDIEKAAIQLNDVRELYMLKHKLGMSEFYNKVNDKENKEIEVEKLRELISNLDLSVLSAYGWDDIPLEHGFHTDKGVTKWGIDTISKKEILSRLLNLNHAIKDAE